MWAKDLLEQVPAAAVRFVLGRQRPEQRRTTFTWHGFTAVVDGELAGSWNAWLGVLFTLLNTHHDGVVAPVAEPGPGDQRFLDRLDRIAGKCLRAYTAAKFSPALLPAARRGGTARRRPRGRARPAVRRRARQPRGRSGSGGSGRCRPPAGTARRADHAGLRDAPVAGAR
ncbi:hypothetical protein E1193_07130 [Micromonospora sp. KC606]|nr:hypothetical protein E1193_07130 [Micromonospora sp. KC606]